MSSESESGRLPNVPNEAKGKGQVETGAEEKADRSLSISQVCTLTGLSARTVRYYEEMDLLPGVRRRAGGRRVYGDPELERLRFIQRLKALGLALGEIKQLNSLYALAGSTADMLEHLDELLGQHLVELEGRIGELMSLRNEMSKYREHVAGRIELLGQTDSATALPSGEERTDQEGRVKQREEDR